MLEIYLSALERDLVRHWIADLSESAGHWGDGRATFPDEEIVSQKLSRDTGTIRITRVHLELILEWAESSHRNVAITPPEIMLIEKLKKVLYQDRPDNTK